MKINEYSVIHPPTGGEVLDETMAAILENEELVLTLCSTKEENSEPLEITFWIGEIINKKELVMIVGSYEEHGRSERIVTICFDNNELPAQATII